MSVRLPGGLPRAALQTHLDAHGIETRHYFAPPLHRQPHWAGSPVLGDLAATETLSEGILSLPTSNRLSPEGVARVCDEILEFGARG